MLHNYNRNQANWDNNRNKTETHKHKHERKKREKKVTDLLISFLGNTCARSALTFRHKMEHVLRDLLILVSYSFSTRLRVSYHVVNKL